MSRLTRFPSFYSSSIIIIRSSGGGGGQLTSVWGNGLVLRSELVSWVRRVSSWFLDLAEWTLSAGTFYQTI